MPGRALARLEQEVGIARLCAQQRLAGRARIERELGSAERLVAGVGLLQVVRQLANPAAQVLLLRDDVLGCSGRRGDAPPREELQHFARPQALARLERGNHAAAVPLDQRELRVHVPLVGEKRGAPFRQDEGAAGPIELGERTPQLARGRVARASPLRVEHASPASVQLPRHLRRDAVAEPVERRPIERVGRDGCTGMRLERRPFAERSRGRHRVASPVQLTDCARQVPPRGRGVPAFQNCSRQRDARQRRGARTPQPHLRAQCGFEQRLRVHRIVAREQQHGPAFLRFSLARGLGGEAIQALRARVQALRVGQRVQLESQVSPCQGDPGARGGRRTGRIGAPLRATQLIARALQITRCGLRPREITPHRQLVRHRPGACIDRECFLQRGACGRIVAAPQLELPETVQRDRGVRPRLVRPPGRERIAVQQFSAPEIPGETRETGQVDQVRCRDLIATALAIENERGVEVPLRLVEIAEPLCQETEIVVVGGSAPRVADAVAQRERVGVVLTRGREVAPFLVGARERPDGVRLDAQVPDRRGEHARPLEISARTVRLAVLEQPCPDVAQQRRHPRRITVRRCACESASPHHDRGMRPVSSERLDTRPAHAVDGHLRRSARNRPGRKARDLTDEKRVAPRDRIGRRDLPGGIELATPQRLGDRVPHGKRPLAHLEDERSGG